MVEFSLVELLYMMMKIYLFFENSKRKEFDDKRRGERKAEIKNENRRKKKDKEKAKHLSPGQIENESSIDQDFGPGSIVSTGQLISKFQIQNSRLSFANQARDVLLIDSRPV